jgi:hypothetical protein
VVIASGKPKLFETRAIARHSGFGHLHALTGNGKSSPNKEAEGFYAKSFWNAHCVYVDQRDWDASPGA